MTEPISKEVVTQYPFVDGNKRTGALLIGVVLRKNGFRFKPRSREYLNVIMGVASGEMGYEHLLEFVRNNV